jgi:hypothetical protein
MGPAWMVGISARIFGHHEPTRIIHGDPVWRKRMSVPPSNPQDTQAVIAVLLVITACLCVVYWRTALRVIVIGAIALAIYGTVVGVDAMTSLLASHRH